MEPLWTLLLLQSLLQFQNTVFQFFLGGASKAEDEAACAFGFETALREWRSENASFQCGFRRAVVVVCKAALQAAENMHASVRRLNVEHAFQFFRSVLDNHVLPRAINSPHAPDVTREMSLC